MIKSVLNYFKSSQKVHEIVGEDCLNKIIEDKDGNRYKIVSTDWSGFHTICLNKDNEPIIETFTRKYTNEVCTRKKTKMIGYYLKGFKLVN